MIAMREIPSGAPEMTHDFPGLPSPPGGPHSLLGSLLNNLLAIGQHGAVHGEDGNDADSNDAVRSGRERAAHEGHAGGSDQGGPLRSPGSPSFHGGDGVPQGLGTVYALVQSVVAAPFSIVQTLLGGSTTPGSGSVPPQPSGPPVNGNVPQPGAPSTTGGTPAPVNTPGQGPVPGGIPTPANGRDAPNLGSPGAGSGQGLPQTLGVVVSTLGRVAADTAGTLVSAPIGNQSTTAALPLPVGVATVVAAAPNALNSLGGAVPNNVGNPLPQGALPTGAAATGYTSVTPSTLPGTAVAAQTSSFAPNAAATTLASPAQLALPQTGTSSLIAGNTLQSMPLQPQGQMATDRLSQLPQTVMPPASTMASTSSAAGNTSAVAPGTTALMTAPMAQPPLSADPRAALPMAGNDRGSPARGEGTMLPAGHTGESQQKRRGRDGRGSDSQSAMTRLMIALSAAGNPAARNQAEARQRAERDLERAMQWVFWILAIIAYGSLGFTVVALMGGNGQGAALAVRIQQASHGWLAMVGLACGAAAWWVARKLPAR